MNIEIDGRKIGEDTPPYVIAEVSGNHNGSLDVALELIAVAKRAGADAVKTQTYTPDTLTLDLDKPDFKVSGGLWDGKTLYELYQWAHTPWDWHKELFACARDLDITMFSSAFDHTAVDLLEKLDCPAYKIASFEAVDLPLIRYVASTRKPMIISTGMATDVEIEEAIDAAKTAGCKSLVVLHCVSGYPAPAQDYNLRTMSDMRRRFGLPVGLSDHTLTNATAVASVALGATVIEKHFTLDRNGGGPDDAFSLEPDELGELCDSVRIAWESLGNVNYARKSSEEKNMVFRRSLYFVQALKAGDVITAEVVRSIRPGFGMPPKLLDQVIGKKVVEDIDLGTPVLEKFLKS